MSGKAARLASIIHDEWRAARGADPAGKKEYAPRMKEVSGVSYDIANLSYEDLPDVFKAENFESAVVAERALLDGISKRLQDDELIECASDQIHEAWLSRNGSWAEPNQKLPYDSLSEVEKDKDRMIARKMLAIINSEI